MWILVLTLMLKLSPSGQAVTSVGGFTSEAACTAAANEWVKRAHDSGNAGSFAVCAKA